MFYPRPSLANVTPTEGDKEPILLPPLPSFLWRLPKERARPTPKEEL